MKIRLTHLDGRLPNLALMKLSHWHRKKKHKVVFSKGVSHDLFEGKFDRVYGSTIFSTSSPKLKRFRSEWPDAIIGGTGSGNVRTVEQELNLSEYEKHDYSIYPNYSFSIGYTQRGCRLKCSFCVVSSKEGAARSVNKISDIYRGKGHVKKLVLMDNDFFGQDRSEWKKRIKEIRDGDFKVSFCQGLNLRLVDDEAARALATIRYYDLEFSRRALYSAWDNLGDQEIFMKGVRALQKAGVPSYHLRVYMLIGYNPKETWEEIFYRYGKMKELGIKPYPMVYDPKRKDLKRFQRWVVMRHDEFIPWEKYTNNRASWTRAGVDDGPELFMEDVK